MGDYNKDFSRGLWGLEPTRVEDSWNQAFLDGVNARKANEKFFSDLSSKSKGAGYSGTYSDANVSSGDDKKSFRQRHPFITYGVIGLALFGGFNVVKSCVTAQSKYVYKPYKDEAKSHYEKLESQEDRFYYNAGGGVYKFLMEDITKKQLESGEVITAKFTNEKPLADAHVSFKAIAKPVDGFEKIAEGGKSYFVTAYVVYHDAEKSGYGLFGNSKYKPSHAIHAVGTIPVVVCVPPGNKERVLIPAFKYFFGPPARGSTNVISNREPEDARDFWSSKKCDDVMNDLHDESKRINDPVDFKAAYKKNMDCQMRQIAFLRRPVVNNAEEAVEKALPKGHVKYVKQESSFFNLAPAVLNHRLSNIDENEILTEAQYNRQKKGVCSRTVSLGDTGMKMEFYPLARTGAMRAIANQFAKQTSSENAGNLFGVKVSPRYVDSGDGKSGDYGAAYYVIGDVNGQRYVFSFDPAAGKVRPGHIDTEEKMANDLKRALATAQTPRFEFVAMNSSKTKAALALNHP